MKKRIGFLNLFSSAIIFGSFGVWIKLLNRDLTMYQQVVLRNLLALFLAVAVIVLGKKYRVNFQTISKKNLFLYSMSVPISVIFYNISVLSLTIALATFSFYVGTIFFSILIGILFFKEKMSPVKWVSLSFALFGLACFVYPFSLNSFNFGLLAGIISGSLDAVSNGFRKNLAGELNKFVLVTITAIGGILVSGFMVIQNHQNIMFITTMNVRTWVIGLIFGAILLLVNYLLLVGFQNFDVGLGVIILSCELFFATLFGYLIFKEIPLTKEITGGMSILIASICPNINWKSFSLLRHNHP